jgi:hypothetical protein
MPPGSSRCGTPEGDVHQGRTHQLPYRIRKKYPGLPLMPYKLRWCGQSPHRLSITLFTIPPVAYFAKAQYHFQR